MEPVANTQQSGNKPQPTSLEQTTINFYFSFAYAVHPEYLAHLGRHSKERVELCDKTLVTLDLAWKQSVRQGILQPDRQALEIGILEDYCENSKKLWKKPRGPVDV
ncbi:hypothetical protein CGRA01v4_06479 [Colletotrichum graminicola]|uniref:Uncharacterized protein n=1 Tax=Colletotrichum graminicola (strain M1.001 / M2 / FGSC 10212) TaxID=645133 RepID=E3Q281_COLGM|nr:uncharacterized protein GLRG_00326 [Colletotrichum graminicola M1.001]EFQ25182.1 hypothetical protein GLRG_00326 [Colletotrichum graminicola M1.001]WDK15198.1 hypothetical protein CGRA01v4_06479 [Colletotrichum graminicola]